MQRIILTLASILAAIGIQARSGNAERLYFSHLNSNTGLSQNTVKCVRQDNYGYIWIGTHQGLNRFDGVEFIHYADELPGSIVTALECDRMNRMWIGTNAGVTIYDPVSEEFTPLKEHVNDPSFSLSDINEIYYDRRGNILIADDSRGVMKVDHEKNPGITAIPSLEAENIGGVTSITSDPGGNLWFGTFGHGIFIAKPDYTDVQPFLDDNGKNIFEEAIVSRLLPVENKIYVATENLGLYEVNCFTHTARQVFSVDETGKVPYIRDLMYFDTDEIWLATESGLYLVNVSTGEFEHYRHDVADPYSLSDNAIYKVYKDYAGGVWIGSYFGGIDYVDVHHSLFNKYYKGFPGYGATGQRVRELAEDSLGRIWMATEDAGVSKYDPKDGTFTHLPASDGFTNVQSLCVDGDKLWIGTFSKGLRILDLKTGHIREIHHNGEGTPASEYIFSIHRTSDGTIYLGTMSGAQIYDREHDRFCDIPELKNIFCYDIFKDSQHDLWIATYSKGLFRYNEKEDKWTNYTHEDNPTAIPSNKIYGIYEDFGRKLWLMTQEGICSFNRRDNIFENDFRERYNLPGMVYQIIEDNGGQYWLTTNNGLYMIDDQRNFMRRYGVDDGLICNQFNYASSLRATDGTIYLGQIEGMISFKPSREYASDEDPKRITITGIYLSDKRLEADMEESPLVRNISLCDDVELSHDQNSLTFKVALLRYNEGKDQPIKYRLNGVDPDWRYTTLGNAKLAYSGLAPGNYSLEVAAVDPLSGVDNPVTRLGIRINSPFYLSRWAILLYLLILGLGIYLAVRYVRRRIRRPLQPEVVSEQPEASPIRPEYCDPKPEADVAIPEPESPQPSIKAKTTTTKPTTSDRSLARTGSPAEKKPATTTQRRAKPTAPEPPDQKFLNELNSIIAENYTDPEFSMELVFRQMRMSHTSFYRKTKVMVHLTPAEYIREYRLKRAAELFEAGYNNVSDVSLMVGFSSPGYFTRCFSKLYKMNPKAYADQFKKNPGTTTSSDPPEPQS